MNSIRNDKICQLEMKYINILKMIVVSILNVLRQNLIQKQTENNHKLVTAPAVQTKMLLRKHATFNGARSWHP